MTDLEFRELTLYRLDGRWEDAEGMSWVDTGNRDPQGQRVYTDGLFYVVRAGAKLRSVDIEATELQGGKA